MGGFEEEKKTSVKGTKQIAGLSNEEELNAKKAARRILAKVHRTIVELVSNLDHNDEGIVNKQELRETLTDANIPDLEVFELASLLKYADIGQKGYICTSKFIDKLYALCEETTADAVLRRLYTQAQHGNLSVREEMNSDDKDDDGNLEKRELKQALQRMRVTVSEDDIAQIFNVFGKAATGQAAPSRHIKT